MLTIKFFIYNHCEGLSQTSDKFGNILFNSESRSWTVRETEQRACQVIPKSYVYGSTNFAGRCYNFFPCGLGEGVGLAVFFPVFSHLQQLLFTLLYNELLLRKFLPFDNTVPMCLRENAQTTDLSSWVQDENIFSTDIQHMKVLFLFKYLY